MEAEKSLGEDWLLWVLTVLAVILGGSYYYYTSSPTTNQNQEPKWVLNKTTRKSIKAISSSKNGTVTFRAERTNGSWTFSKPRDVRISDTNVHRWLNDFLNPRLVDKFPAKKNRDYGFGKSSTVIEVERESGKQRFFIGNEDPLGSGFYVRPGKSGNGSVYVMESQFREDFVPTLKDLRRKKLFMSQPGDVNSLQLETPAGSVTYSRIPGGWRMTSPDTRVLSDTDNRTMNKGLRSLLSLKASTFFDTAPPANLRPYGAKIHLEMKGGKTRHLKVGGEKDGDRLISLHGWPPVTVDSDPAGAFGELPKLPEDWPTPVGGSNSPRPGQSLRKGKNVPSILKNQTGSS